MQKDARSKRWDARYLFSTPPLLGYKRKTKSMYPSDKERFIPHRPVSCRSPNALHVPSPSPPCAHPGHQSNRNMFEERRNDVQIPPLLQQRQLPFYSHVPNSLRHHPQPLSPVFNVEKVVLEPHGHLDLRSSVICREG